MAKRYVFEEGQVANVPVSFETPEGASYIPLSVEYKVTDVRTGKVYQDWLNIPPAASTEINTPPLEIESSRRKHEKKEVAVRTDVGTETQSVKSIIIWAKNIRAIQ